ncbi:MAG TPA: hypothetical protein VGP72_05000 [Planctomycetota bacterium]|jgi:hypothetical protein
MSLLGARFLLIGVLVGAGLAYAAEDRVIMVRNNEVRSGVITKADLDGVELQMRDAKTSQVAKMTMGGAEIANIEWDSGSPEYRSAMANYDSQHYAEGVRDFQSILNDKDDLEKFRAVCKPALYFYYAQSLYLSGKPSEAIPAFEKLMNEFKNSYYVPAAVGSLVDCAIITKDLSKVPPLLSQLRALGMEQKALADYYEGQMLLAQNKAKEADSKFAAAAGGSSVPSTKGMALMGQAKCAVGEGNLVKARDLAQKALAAGAPRDVSGAAHLVIGDAVLAEVEAQKPTGDVLQTKLMDALLEYMRVLEQYRGNVDNEAQAMLHAGDALIKLSKLPNRSADMHRAITLYTKLVQDPRYRSTRYAGLAETAMKAIRR